MWAQQPTGWAKKWPGRSRSCGWALKDALRSLVSTKEVFPLTKILVLNAGSSSQKCSLYTLPDTGVLPAEPLAPTWEAHADGADLAVSTSSGAKFERTLPSAFPAEALPQLLETLWQGPTQVIAGPSEVTAVGHRVVHGGRAYRESTRITPEVERVIGELSALAPAHNPAALAGIRVAKELFGDAPQVAVFDTAFHATLPDAAAVYPGPYRWAEAGVRRYGFHGISHAYAAGRAAQLLGRPLESLKLITCHLGNGCSLAAVKEGKSVDTTMGFTPLEGLMMGTRSGTLDPGLLVYLLREGYTAAELDRTLNQESGLKGLSGVSGDLRAVSAAAAAGNPQAELALLVYLHRIRFFVGAMLASLGGLDALVFTAGVGEHSAWVRREACAAFEFLGVRLDASKEEGSEDRDVAAADAPVRVLVVHARENWAIAESCVRLLGASHAA